MSCVVCTMKLTPEVTKLVDQACGPCQRQIKQMQAGFHGIVIEPKSERVIWDNTIEYTAWQEKLTDEDVKPVTLNKRDEYVTLRCDVRDMKRIVGLPKFLPLEQQVYTAWIVEGTKNERIQEVLGLTYTQLMQVKKVIRFKLQKQMRYYQQIQKLEREGKTDGKV